MLDGVILDKNSGQAMATTIKWQCCRPMAGTIWKWETIKGMGVTFTSRAWNWDALVEYGAYVTPEFHPNTQHISKWTVETDGGAHLRDFAIYHCHDLSSVGDLRRSCDQSSHLVTDVDSRYARANTSVNTRADSISDTATNSSSYSVSYSPADTGPYPIARRCANRACTNACSYSIPNRAANPGTSLGHSCPNIGDSDCSSNEWSNRQPY